MISHINKDDYRKGFLRRRILPILSTYIVVSFLYWLENLLVGNLLSVKAITLNQFYMENRLRSILGILLVYCSFTFAFMSS